MTRVQRETETHGGSLNAQGIGGRALDLGEGVWACGIHPNVARNKRERGGGYSFPGLTGCSSLICNVTNRAVQPPEEYVLVVHQDHAGARFRCETGLPKETYRTQSLERINRRTGENSRSKRIYDYGKSREVCMVLRCSNNIVPVFCRGGLRLC